MFILIVFGRCNLFAMVVTLKLCKFLSKQYFVMFI